MTRNERLLYMILFSGLVLWMRTTRPHETTLEYITSSISTDRDSFFHAFTQPYSYQSSSSSSRLGKRRSRSQYHHHPNRKGPPLQESTNGGGRTTTNTTPLFSFHPRPRQEPPLHVIFCPSIQRLHQYPSRSKTSSTNHAIDPTEPTRRRNHPGHVSSWRIVQHLKTTTTTTTTINETRSGNATTRQSDAVHHGPSDTSTRRRRSLETLQARLVRQVWRQQQQQQQQQQQHSNKNRLAVPLDCASCGGSHNENCSSVFRWTVLEDDQHFQMTTTRQGNNNHSSIRWDEFDFVGLLDRMEETAVLLSMLLQVPLRTVLYCEHERQPPEENAPSVDTYLAQNEQPPQSQPQPARANRVGLQQQLLPETTRSTTINNNSAVSNPTESSITTSAEQQSSQWSLLYQAVNTSLDWTIQNLVGPAKFAEQLKKYQQAKQELQTHCTEFCQAADNCDMAALDRLISTVAFD